MEPKLCITCKISPQLINPTTGYGLSYCGSCRATYKRGWNIALKREIMGWYGTVCVCCGEGGLSFLTLDHIKDDGVREFNGIPASRRVGNDRNVGGGVHLYRKIRKAGFEKRPIGMQVLCFNCQWGKQLNRGHCPHHPEIDLRIRAHKFTEPYERELYT